MRSTNVLKSRILLIVILTILPMTICAWAVPPNWIIRQLTENGRDDLDPMVSGVNIVWHSSDAGQYGLWLYYGAADQTVLLAEDDESFADRYHINGSKVTWSNDGIFIYNAEDETTTQIASDPCCFSSPVIYGDKVAWHADDGSDLEIFFFNGSSITQVTNNNFDDHGPVLSWYVLSWLGMPDGTDDELYRAMTNNLTNIYRTTDDDTNEYDLDIYGADVVWPREISGDTQIRISRNTINPPLAVSAGTYNNTDPRIDDNNVVWKCLPTAVAPDTVIYHYNIFTWARTQLSSGSYSSRSPDVSGTNVVWSAELAPGNSEVYFYDLVTSSATRLTENSMDDTDTCISGSRVVWVGTEAGQDSEIFFASRVIYVDPEATDGNNDGSSWQDAFTSLDDAIDYASLGTTLRVAQGTYVPTIKTISMYPRSVTFQLKDGVAVYGGYGGVTAPDPDRRDPNLYPSVLSGDIDGNDYSGGDNSENAYHVVYSLSNGASTILDGFTITGGNANSTAKNDRGGGVFALSSLANISNCTFTQNYARYGGAICNQGEGPKISDCTFYENYCYSSGGGAIFNNSSGAVISDCLFYNNSAGPYSGGAVYNMVPYGNSLTPTIIDCSFISNTANVGAAIVNKGDHGPPPTIENCLFKGNVSNFNGSAIYNYNISAIINNCVIVGNAALGSGAGAIYNNSPYTMGQQPSEPIITNCTIAYNTSAVGGTIMNTYTSRGYKSTVINSVFWGNTAGYSTTEAQQVGYGTVASYTCIEGLSALAGNGNIGSDPMFAITPDDGGDGWGVGYDDFGDLHLMPGSGCLDAASDAGIYTDIDGNIRPLDFPQTDNNGPLPEFDMGAYEHFSVNVAPIADAGDDVEVSADDQCGAIVTLNGSSSSDADGDTLTYYWFYGGELFAEEMEVEAELGLGEHVFTLIVNDGMVDSEADEVVVTVVDDTGPELSVEMDPMILWPANNKMVLVIPDPEVSDNCGGEIGIELVGITCNQAGEDDIERTEEEIFLRAKRDAKDKDDRVYTIVYKATDESGNETIASVEVKVPHDLGKKTGSGG